MLVASFSVKARAELGGCQRVPLVFAPASSLEGDDCL